MFIDRFLYFLLSILLLPCSLLGGGNFLYLDYSFNGLEPNIVDEEQQGVFSMESTTKTAIGFNTSLIKKFNSGKLEHHKKEFLHSPSQKSHDVLFFISYEKGSSDHQNIHGKSLDLGTSVEFEQLRLGMEGIYPFRKYFYGILGVQTGILRMKGDVYSTNYALGSFPENKSDYSLCSQSKTVEAVKANCNYYKFDKTFSDFFDSENWGIILGAGMQYGYLSLRGTFGGYGYEEDGRGFNMGTYEVVGRVEVPF